MVVGGIVGGIAVITMVLFATGIIPISKITSSFNSVTEAIPSPQSSLPQLPKTSTPATTLTPIATYKSCTMAISYRLMQMDLNCNNSQNGYDAGRYSLKVPEKWKAIAVGDSGFGTANKLIVYQGGQFDIVLADQVSEKTYRTTYWELPQ
jgi:hypothetical protein